MKLVLIMILLFPMTLTAHKINVFAKKEQESIYVKAYFSKNTPCKDCKVILLGKDGKQVHTKKSDNKGEVYFSFPQTDIKSIEVIASMGHKNVISFFIKGNKEPFSIYTKSLFAFTIFLIIFSLLFYLKRKQQ